MAAGNAVEAGQGANGAGSAPADKGSAAASRLDSHDPIDAEKESQSARGVKIDHRRPDMSGRKKSAGGRLSVSAERARMNEEAAVGSIHHILRTAFRELYAAPDDDVEEPGGPTTPASGSDQPSTRESMSTPTAADEALTPEGDCCSECKCYKYMNPFQEDQ